jgi:hypothetical protein
MSTTKTFTVEAEEFVGQDVPGWQIEHLMVDLAGNPVRQARQKFEGGEQIAHQGDWIATFPSGQQVILTRATWQGETPPETVLIDGQRIPIAEATEKKTTQTVRVAEPVKVEPMGAAEWPAKIVEHDVQLPAEDATRKDPDTGHAQTYHRATGWTDDNPDAPAAGDSDNVHAEAVAPPETQAEAPAQEGE